MSNRTNRITFEMICEAKAGDADSMQAVLDHYHGYIQKLATKKLYDRNGNVYSGIDQTLQNRLEMKLMLAVLKFRFLDE